MTRLVILGLVAGLGSLAQAGMAQAVALPANSITQTAITSPSDPSYFYDPYGGAVDSNSNALGGFTVSGTTNSTAPSTDEVDIDCFQDDNGATGVSDATLVSDVSLDSDGSFSAFVPYSAFDSQYRGVGSQPECILRAVPAGSEPSYGSPMDIATYSGPKVFVAYLAQQWGFTTSYDYELVAPQADATDVYYSAGDCGLAATFLNDPTYFANVDSQSFACNDTTGVSPQEYPYSPYEDGDVEVDGNPTYTPFLASPPPGSPGLTVSAIQDPTDGDMTIQETDPLYVCTVEDPVTAGVCDTYASAGVSEDRTIYQTDSGKVVLITDSFVSTDGGAHSVTLDLENQQCFQSPGCQSGDFAPSGVAYEFPGQNSFSVYADGNSVDDSDAPTPATIYVEQAQGKTDESIRSISRQSVESSSFTGAAPYGSITYFTAPTTSFSLEAPYEDGCCYFQNSFISEWDLSVPANGSAQLSFGYSTDSTLAEVRDVDVPDVISLERNPPSSGSSTPTTPTGPTDYTSASTSGSSTTTIPGVQPAFSGPNYHTVADTGIATQARRRAERLHGSVTAGSDSVSYYFDYGTSKHYGHRSKTLYLAAGDAMKPVALTVAGLHAGTTYHYKLVAVGAGGGAVGADRTFRAGQA